MDKSNACGLIAGNLKRHLKAKHTSNADNVHGQDLMSYAHKLCETCMRHVEALTREMNRVNLPG